MDRSGGCSRWDGSVPAVCHSVQDSHSKEDLDWPSRTRQGQGTEVPGHRNNLFLGSKDIHYQDLILTPFLCFFSLASASLPGPLWLRPWVSVQRPSCDVHMQSHPESNHRGPGNAVLFDWPDTSLEPLSLTLAWEKDWYSGGNWGTVSKGKSKGSWAAKITDGGNQLYCSEKSLPNEGRHLFCDKKPMEEDNKM